MISLPGHTVLHVIGRARPGDPTTAAARALCRRLDRIGRPGRLVSIAPAPGLPDVAPLDAAALQAASAVVVHSDDGGEALLPAAAALSARPLHLVHRSEEHTSELQSLMRISYAVFCLKKKTIHSTTSPRNTY